MKIVFFFFGLNIPPKINEERGCMDDLEKLIPELAKIGSLTDDSGDYCQTLAANYGGSSICKCTTSLCNSARQISAFAFYPVLILILTMKIINY